MTLSVQSMVVALQSLKSDLRPLNLDQINFIKTYIEKTGLKTNIFPILASLRKDLINIDDDELDQKYVDIKKAFITYIETRINHLENKENCSIDDPWMNLEFRVKDHNRKAEYQTISLHVQDILFSAEQIIQKQLKQGVAVEVKEIHEFRRNTLKGYLTQLPPAESLTGAKELRRQFRRMEKALESSNFQEAEKASSAIRTWLKSYKIGADQLSQDSRSSNTSAPLLTAQA